MGPAQDSTSAALLEAHQKSHIGQIEALYQLLCWNDEWVIEPAKEKLLHIKSLVLEEVKKRQEAEKDVHRAIMACAQLCDGIQPIKNKYGR